MSDFDAKILSRLKNLEQEVQRLKTGERPKKAWTNYTPTWTATTTAPVLGNGTLNGRYTKIGKTIVGDILLAMGSTTTYGSGGWSLSLPFSCASSSIRYGGSWAVVDAGTTNYAGSLFIVAGSSTVGFFVRDAGPNFFSNTLPHTWASGDTLYLSFAYEVI